MTQQKIPAFEMPNGDVLYVSYNKESDMIDIGPVTNAGDVYKRQLRSQSSVANTPFRVFATAPVLPPASWSVPR